MIIIKIKNFLMLFLFSFVVLPLYAQEREEILRMIPSMTAPARPGQTEGTAVQNNAQMAQKESVAPQKESAPLAAENDSNTQQANQGAFIQKGEDQTQASYSYLWVSVIFGLGLVALLGAGKHVFDWKFRKNVSLPHEGNKMMGVLSTLSLGPKRQILLVRVREKEMILANTEKGLALLSEGMAALPLASQVMHNMQNDLERNKKPDLLLKALQSIESENKKENKVPFSQYLTTAFEKEGKKGSLESIETPSAASLIREKLKTMRPLG